MMKIVHTEDVDELRRTAYPPLEDFADAWFHLQRGDGAKMDGYLEKCRFVKAAFSKNVFCDSSDVAANIFLK